jgi:hypothetical protein
LTFVIVTLLMHLINLRELRAFALYPQ